MLELLQRLLFGHAHSWERQETILVHDRGNPNPEGKIVILRCTQCGRLKNHKIYW